LEKLIVACVQQRMRLPETVDEYQEDLRRFLRAAANKRARLVIFPELAGMMTAPPLLRGTQATLFKSVDRARRRQASLWQKTTGHFAGAAVKFLKVDLRRLFAGLLDLSAPELWQQYVDIFGKLASEFDVTLVAPSAYLPDPLDGVIRNIAAVFSPHGEMLGYQAKGLLHAEDTDLAQPGNEWRVIPTDVGRIGLMLGSDMLYPEVGRLLAYQGAEILIGQGAAMDRALYEKLRASMLARMQENQLFAALSFLVGPNEFGRRAERAPFVGKSAIFAPQELTPASSGVLVEMSNMRSESVLAAVWDFPALKELWETSEIPVRSQTSAQQTAPLLAALYQQLNRLPKSPDLLALPEHSHAYHSDLHSLDELPVLASVTSRWPLVSAEDHPPHPEDHSNPATADKNGNSAFLRSALNTAENKQEPVVEEETQEMDALLEPTPKEKNGE
jgi:predicted amidohydrolase